MPTTLVFRLKSPCFFGFSSLATCAWLLLRPKRPQRAVTVALSCAVSGSRVTHTHTFPLGRLFLQGSLAPLIPSFLSSFLVSSFRRRAHAAAAPSSSQSPPSLAGSVQGRIPHNSFVGVLFRRSFIIIRERRSKTSCLVGLVVYCVILRMAVHRF